MSAPHDGGMEFAGRGPRFWLPPNGFGNGIGASAWAELADLPEGELEAVMFEMTDARIAAYVAIPRAAPHPADPHAPVMYRLWVDSLRYRHAEDLLMEVLAKLHHTRPPRSH